MCCASGARRSPSPSWLDLRRPHLDQGELGRDEEAVEEHEQEREGDRDRRVDFEAHRCGR